MDEARISSAEMAQFARLGGRAENHSGGRFQRTEHVGKFGVTHRADND